MLFKNGEGYPDPTAAGAIREADKVPDHVNWYIKTIKEIASLIGLEMVGRVCIKDKKTGREYR